MSKRVKQGWQCPECKTVYAPRVRECKCAVQKHEAPIGLAAGAVINVPDPGFWTEVPKPDQWVVKIANGLWDVTSTRNWQ